MATRHSPTWYSHLGVPLIIIIALNVVEKLPHSMQPDQNEFDNEERYMTTVNHFTIKLLFFLNSIIGKMIYYLIRRRRILFANVDFLWKCIRRWRKTDTSLNFTGYRTDEMDFYPTIDRGLFFCSMVFCGMITLGWWTPPIVHWVYISVSLLCPLTIFSGENLPTLTDHLHLFLAAFILADHGYGDSPE